MRKLFEIGFNEGGFYIYPYTNCPRHQEVHGDEIRLAQAIELRNSLNRSVKTYILDSSVEIIQLLGKHQGWQATLKTISNAIWHQCLHAEDETPQGALYQNCLALGRLVAGWLE